MCMHHILVWSLQNRHAHFPTHPGRPHLHWESPLCIEASHSSMYNSICTGCLHLHLSFMMCVDLHSSAYWVRGSLSHASRTPAPALSITLCIEASSRSIVYTVCVCASNPIVVTLKWTAHFPMCHGHLHLHWALTLYGQRPACTLVCTTVQADVWYYGVCMCTKSDFGCLRWTYALFHVSWMPTPALVFYYVCWPAQRHAHVHLLLCKEAGIHPSMYTSTSRCIMCACASYLIMVTLKLTCALSKAS